MRYYNPVVVRCVAPTSLAIPAALRARLLPREFRFLAVGHTKRPIPEALAFLKAQCLTGRSEFKLTSPDTCERYAYDLCDFFAYLDHRGKRVGAIDAELIDDWLDTMDGQLSARGTAYKPETIKTRISTVGQFALFAQSQGWLSARLPVRYVNDRGEPRKVLDLARRVIHQSADDDCVRPIAQQDLQELLGQMGHLKCDPDGIPIAAARNRLIGEVALQGGLRRAETVTLKLNQVMQYDLTGVDPFANRVVRVFGKGSKWRSVPLPVWLLKLLQHYARNERANAVGSGNDHGVLFVHGPEHTRAGLPIKPKAVSIWFAKAKAEVMSRVKDLGRRARLMQHTFHSLRHTFALLTYVYRRTFLGDMNPGKYVQGVLGHASQETTDRIYLQASHIRESEIAAAFQQEMMRWAA